MKKTICALRAIAVMAPCLLLSNLASAAIIETNAEAGLIISSGGVTDASATDSGETSASISLTGMNTGATAFADVWFSGLTDETASMNFNIGWDGTAASGRGFMGVLDSMQTSLTYFAESDTVVTMDWDFSYSGSQPFGLQIVEVAGADLSQTLGNAGRVGTHSGSQMANLTGGSNYMISLIFNSNVSGQLSSLQGTLAGSFDFTFDSVAVPEPASMSLLGLGLFGVIASRRRRQS